MQCTTSWQPQPWKVIHVHSFNKDLNYTNNVLARRTTEIKKMVPVLKEFIVNTHFLPHHMKLLRSVEQETWFAFLI